MRPKPVLQQYSPKDNAVLAALPPAEYARLFPHLEPVQLSAGELLYGLGVPLTHFHFPVSGVVSMLHITKDGRTAEIAVLGRDGFVGITHLLGGTTTLNRKVVQIAGHAYRISATIVMNEFHRPESALHHVLLRHVQSVMTQMAQTAVCNRHHRVEQQLCRWLLLNLDLVEGDEVHMTQELFSQMLGVQRTGITLAAKHLASAGVIEHERGFIRVPDRTKLAAYACECYEEVKKERVRTLIE